MILAKYFVKQVKMDKIDLKNKKILELGSGTGVVSIFLGYLGNELLFLILLDN